MFRLPILVLCITTFIGAVSAADMVVVNSEGTLPFSEGQLLSSDMPLNLLEEDKLTVVFASGGANTVTGSYQGQLTDPLPNHEADPHLVTAIANHLTKNNKFRSMVVISSNTKLFPVGQLLNSHNDLNLPAETKITVVFDSGSVQKVTGPHWGPLTDPSLNTEANLNLVTALATLLTEPKVPHRGQKSNGQKLDNIWWVDVSAHKRFYCVAPFSNDVILWRPEDQSQGASRLVIKHKRTGQKTTVVWPARQTTLEWPEQLPIVYGDTYLIRVKPRKGSPSFKKLVLYQLPNSLPTKSHKVVWMVGRGCIPQANLLLASLF
ncbi:MAG: hypothetical protein DRR19_02405 [Candidatus Parabeggiatoa sp. nov. 1]|nr:MAG: hypothetical protein DRR19_02405 [Gammaproteobacteria bacterium]